MKLTPEQTARVADWEQDVGKQADPQPAPDREALVEAFENAMLSVCDCIPDVRRDAEERADALLARGLRLPGEETMAWAVVMEVGGPIPREVYPTLSEAKEAASLYGGRPVRVAIRVVEEDSNE